MADADGSDPSTNSPIYTAPLLLTNSALLQARSFFPDGKSSGPLVETYTLLDTNVAAGARLPLQALSLLLRRFRQVSLVRAQTMKRFEEVLLLQFGKIAPR